MPSDPREPREFHPAGSPVHAAAELAPLPWTALTKADCLLWAIALHRAAVAARLANGADR